MNFITNQYKIWNDTIELYAGGLFFLLGWQIAMQTTINSNHKQIISQIKEAQLQLSENNYQCMFLLSGAMEEANK